MLNKLANDYDNRFDYPNHLLVYLAFTERANGSAAEAEAAAELATAEACVIPYLRYISADNKIGGDYFRRRYISVPYYPNFGICLRRIFLNFKICF